MESNLNEKLSNYKLNGAHGPLPPGRDEEGFSFRLIGRRNFSLFTQREESDLKSFHSIEKYEKELVSSCFLRPSKFVFIKLFSINLF